MPVIPKTSRPASGIRRLLIPVALVAGFIGVQARRIGSSRLVGDTLRFLKNWTLPVAIAVGIIGYFAYIHIPWLDATHHAVRRTVSLIQPALIFLMLFLSFCKVDPRDLRPQGWQAWNLLLQCGMFLLSAGVILGFRFMAHPLSSDAEVLWQTWMLCLMCPTATAAIVIVAKLGGDSAGMTTYTLLVNLAASLLLPLVLPVVHPAEGLTFLSLFFKIILQVVPTMIFPFVIAMTVRFVFPRFHRMILATRDLAFYLWSVALVLAIAVSVHSIVSTSSSARLIALIALISAVACALQFAYGRLIGSRYARPIAGGQSLGQKNTVFLIWIGASFLNPVVSVAGGFYSVWHNIFNSWQLYRHRRSAQPASAVAEKIL